MGNQETDEKLNYLLQRLEQLEVSLSERPAKKSSKDSPTTTTQPDLSQLAGLISQGNAQVADAVGKAVNEALQKQSEADERTWNRLLAIQEKFQALQDFGDYPESEPEPEEEEQGFDIESIGQIFEKGLEVMDKRKQRVFQQQAFNDFLSGEGQQTPAPQTPQSTTEPASPDSGSADSHNPIYAAGGRITPPGPQSEGE